MARAFHPINILNSISTCLENTIRRRHFDHNCLVFIARPCFAGFSHMDPDPTGVWSAVYRFMQSYRIVFEESSSRTALTWHIGMNTKANIFGLLIWKFNILRVIEENAYSKKYSTLQKEINKIGFKCYSKVSLHFRLM